jgi:NADPH:quinone reductase-like Zn-dependent oxidoreductase
MKYLTSQTNAVYTSLLMLLLVLGFSFNSQAHCDRINGPVAQAAKQALETGDVSEALIWVGEQQTEELKSKFQQSLKVYNSGEESQHLAERYFMETTVRLHREAEGMSYTGLKPAQPSSEDIQTAEQALDSGNLSPVTDLLAKEIRQKTNELYQQAMQAKENRGQSVEAGRRWVDAYVKYIVYVHSLHQKIQAGPAHGVGK